jgi:hypothetical protein
MTANLERRREDRRDSLASLIARFEVDQTAIEVNFRHLMPAELGVARHAHAIHPYPAKLLVNIP